MKRWLTILVGVLVTAITLAYALQGNDISTIGQEFTKGRYLYAIPALIVAVIGLGLRAFRWQVLLNDKIKLIHSFHITNVGYFFSVWLPLRLNEVARSFLVTRLKPPISIFTSLSSIVVERLVDLLTVVVLVVLAITLIPQAPPELVTGARAAGLSAGLGIVFLWLFAVRRPLAVRFVNLVLKVLPFLEKLHIRHIVERLLDGIAPLASITSMLRVVFWTAVAWTCSVAAGFILLYVFYDDPNWASALLMIAAASIAIALPAVPGSVGPFEAAIIFGLQVGGLTGGVNTPERAFAFAVVLHLFNAGVYAILGLFGLAREKITVGEVVRAAQQIAARNKAEENAADQGVTNLPSEDKAG